MLQVFVKKCKKISKLWEKISRFLLDIILPVSCIVCDSPGRLPGDFLCPQHKKFLQKYPTSCYVCHKPTQYGNVCIDHMDAPCTGMIVGFYYTNIIKKLIHLMKYSGAYEIAGFFAQQLLYDITTNPVLMHAIAQDKLLITYIPMHWWKQHHIRGYNQAEKLAQALGTLLAVDCISLCEKSENTRTQSSLNRQQRQKNSENVYVYSASCDLTKYTTVLLVDDVLTTGTTINICAKLIAQHNSHLTVRGVAITRNTL